MIGKTISHYKILEKLGEGGMGVVYKAEDTKLKRTVALKFLPSHLVANEEDRTRFLHEAQAASALNHPNVMTIYEIDEFEGETFIAMELVEGESLKTKVEKGPLRTKELLKTAIAVAEGLNAAHEKEIIHRDIKSENIMISKDGLVKIMDFGIAKRKGVTRVTKEGSTLGTLAYMSPEQAEGLEVDRRGDLFSFGVVMYEMATGQLPFKGEHDAAILYAIVNETPLPVTTLNPNVPGELERITHKALEKDPEKRYQNMQEVLKELKKPLSSIAVSEKKEKSIVVLPFEDISPGKDNEYFSDGLTEEIITDLSQIHDLLVISRSSAMTFKGTKKKIREIAKEVNVRYVLEGSVRKAGNNLRITAQLIDAANDAHLWAEKYKGTLDDIFDIQEKVSRSIVDALKLKLSPEEDRRITKRPIKDLVAYECYLRAKQKMVCWTEDAIDNAIVLLERALQIDGPNELLFATLGFAYTRYWGALPFRQDESELEKADTYADRVFKLNPDSPDGHVLKGTVLFFQGKPHEAVTHIKKTYHMDPKNSNALFYLVWLSGVTGHMDAARFYFEKLTTVDPWSGVNPGWIEYYSGNFNEAVDGYRKEYEMDPESPYTRWAYACVLAWAHRTKEACEILEKMVRDTPDSIFGQFASLLRNALRGRTDEALRVITPELISAAKLHWQLPWMLASIYSMLGKTDESLDWLEHAISRGFINYPFLSKEEPFLENIRGEERFKRLMEKVKYEWEHFEV